MRFVLVVLFFWYGLFSGCVQSQEIDDSINPELVGISAKLMEEIEQNVSELPNILSFIVSKDSMIISENYYNGSNQRSLHHIRSITKSITSLSISVLLEEHQSFDPKNKIIDFYPNSNGYPDTSFINDMTIQHILDMQSGFDWNESLEVFNWYTSVQNPTNYILSKKVVEKPGAVWNYNSGAVHLLSTIFDSLAGVNQEHFCEQVLFKPLEITNFSWDKDPTGVVRPDAGLQLTARDLIKIGQLILNEGNIGNQKIINKKLIENIFRFRINLNSDYGPLTNLHYNELWWLAEYKSKKILFALGYGGQLLIVIPNLEMILVANHLYQLKPEIANKQGRAFLEAALVPLINHLTKK